MSRVFDAQRWEFVHPCHRGGFNLTCGGINCTVSPPLVKSSYFFGIRFSLRIVASGHFVLPAEQTLLTVCRVIWPLRGPVQIIELRGMSFEMTAPVAMEQAHLRFFTHSGLCLVLFRL